MDKREKKQNKNNPLAPNEAVEIFAEILIKFHDECASNRDSGESELSINKIQ